MIEVRLLKVNFLKSNNIINSGKIIKYNKTHLDAFMKETFSNSEKPKGNYRVEGFAKTPKRWITMCEMKF